MRASMWLPVFITLSSAVLCTAQPQASRNLSPTPTLSTKATIISTTGFHLRSRAAGRFSRRGDYDPSIPPLTLNLPTISIPEPSIPSLSLNLPPVTCTPGFSSYATPGLNGYVPADACNALWLYFPNFAAAIVFSILFGILTILHLAQAIHYRNGFCWVIIMATAWETGAYTFRALGSKNQQSSGIAIVAQLLVLVAPVWVNAFAYMVFARIVHFYSPNRKVWFFSPSSLALIFVTLDITAFVIQLVGGGMAGPGASPESQRKGLDIYIGGIGLQEGFIILFSGLVIKFHRDQLRAERLGNSAMDKITGWRQLIYALYGCLVAITIRIIYRMGEFSAGLGPSNPLPSNEPVLYVLESTPMWIAIMLWNIFHPGRFIYGEDAKMPPSWLSRDGKFRSCCCCCCNRRRERRRNGHSDQFRDARGQHQRLADEMELEDKQQQHYDDLNSYTLRHEESFVQESRSRE